MFRTLLLCICLLLSLFTVLPIPSKQFWYLAIAVAEFPWVWILIVVLLIGWNSATHRYRLAGGIIGIIAVVLFSIPIVRAYSIADTLDQRLLSGLGIKQAPLNSFHRSSPFSLAQMVTGIGASKIPYSTHQYAAGGEEHSLHFYPSQVTGPRPCLIVVHGGSWKSGNNNELPDVDNYFAKAGYQVATINYRLAPQYKSPAPQEDVRSAFQWLRQHAVELNIDINNFVLLGRSAGGQIVLNAAYSLQEPGLKGVISFYGPTDMLFAYNDDHNKLVMDHQQVMRDFFGGSPDEVRQQYIDGSPVHYVNAQSVPTLMVHGMLDQHVHFRESEILDRKLAEAGVPHMLLGIPWATHGCEYSLNGPSGQLSVYAMERFMAAVTQPRQ